MRGLIAAIVVRPVTTTMVTITVLLFGLVAALRLPVELLPELSYPTITVRTVDPDAAPAEVEELVTRPIEERVGAVAGLIKAESVSSEGQSDVVLDFAWGTSMDKAMADVREKLDRVVLPATAQRPILLRYDPSQEPIMRLALRPTNDDARVAPVDLAVMRETADRAVKRELEKLPGVAAVEIHGGEREEVAVDLDQDRLNALGLSTDEVIAALTRDNVNRPGGAVDERDNRYLLRTLHEAKTPADFEDVIVRSIGGAELRLGDVAKVSRVPVEQEELSLVGGREAVELAVYREGDGNLVAVAQAVTKAIKQLPLPAGHELVVLSNRAEFIESSVREVLKNTLTGGALAIFVLLFFLRDARATLVIAAAIPISLLAAFVPMAALGVSLNIMSLGGLALGVGMLVDNSIVVLESIARVAHSHNSLGGADTPARRRAVAVEGTGEVASSVVASTLTTIAVFLPMAFVEGVAGQLVRDLSLAVSFSILSSMLMSLTLVPVLQSLGGTQALEGGEARRFSRLWLATVGPVVLVVALVVRLVGAVVGILGRLLSLLSAPAALLYQKLAARYPGLLRTALRRPGLILMIAVGICVVTVPMADRYGRTLIPELDQRELFVQVELPQGTSLARTAELMRVLGEAAAQDPAVELHFGRAGSLTQAGSAGGNVTGTHLGQLDIRLARGATTDPELVEGRLLARLAAANTEPAAKLRLGQPTLVAFGPPIEVQMFGEDPQATAAAARAIVPGLREIDGVAEVSPDDLDGRPEARIHFDRERLGRLGLTVEAAVVAVSRAVQGEVATQLHAPDRQLDVRVRLPRKDRSSVADLSSIQVGISGDVPVRLDAVAEVKSGQGPAEIRRIDGRRGFRIRVRVDAVNLAGVASEVTALLERQIDPASGVSFAVSGQAADLESSLRSIAFTAALSIFLVYVVMAATFESLRHPLIILLVVPLAAAGVSLGCVVARIPLSAMVGIGAIVLAGIVVNNAIVLISAINDRRGAGVPLGEAVIDAAQVRLRPIVMTTATTVLGLVPMALGLGDGAALRQPLAVSIMSGLLLSTLLTLVVIPAAYLLAPGPVRPAWKPDGEA